MRLGGYRQKTETRLKKIVVCGIIDHPPPGPLPEHERNKNKA